MNNLNLKAGEYNSVFLKALYLSLKNDPSQWGLAIEQRLPVWESDHIIKLLDSIMRESNGVTSTHYTSIENMGGIGGSPGIGQV